MKYPKYSLAMFMVTLSGTLLAVDDDASSNRKNDEIYVLNPFMVQASSNDQGYRTQATAASNFAIDVQELPLAVKIYNENFIKDVSAQSVFDVLQYDSSTRQHDIVVAGQPQSYRIRGNLAGFLRDGLAFDTSSDGLHISRVEIIKGPQAVLYGLGNAGGYVNVLTKTPPAKPRANILARFGTEDYMKGGFELGGPVNRSGSLRYYLSASRLDTKAFQDYSFNQVTSLFGAATWSITPSAKLDLDYEYTDRHDGFQSRAVFNNTYTGIRFDVPKEFNTAGPLSFFDSTRHTWTGNFTLRISDNLHFRATGRYWRRDIEELRRVGEAFGDRQAPNPNLVGTTYLAQIFDQDFLNSRFDLLLDHNRWDNFKVRANLGLRISNSDTATYARGSTTPGYALDPFALDYAPGDALFLQTVGAQGLRAWNLGIAPVLRHTTDTFGYLFTRLETLHGKLFVNMGLSDLLDDNTLPYDTAAPQFGILYRITPRISAYASYAESWEKQGQTLQPGQLISGGLAPVTTEAMEFGLKFISPDNKIQGTLAYFDVDLVDILRQTGGITSNGLPTYALSGAENSRGVELETSMSLTRNWSVITSLTYTDAKVTKNEQTPILIGSPAQGVPEFAASIWSRYNFTEGLLKGVGVGAGVLYSDRVLIFAQPTRLTLYAPSFAQINAMASYGFKLRKSQFKVQCNLDNITSDIIIGGGGERRPPFEARMSLSWEY